MTATKLTDTQRVTAGLKMTHCVGVKRTHLS